MAKHTYKIEFEGQTFKRTTERVYAFVVLARNPRFERLEARRLADLKSETANAAKYRKTVETGKCQDARPGASGDWDRECNARFLADGSFTKWIADCDKNVKRLTEQRIITEDQETPWESRGWSSRIDLARKVADGSDYYRRVVILDAVTGQEVR